MSANELVRAVKCSEQILLRELSLIVCSPSISSHGWKAFRELDSQAFPDISSVYRTRTYSLNFKIFKEFPGFSGLVGNLMLNAWKGEVWKENQASREFEDVSFGIPAPRSDHLSYEKNLWGVEAFIHNYKTCVQYREQCNGWWPSYKLYHKTNQEPQFSIYTKTSKTKYDPHSILTTTKFQIVTKSMKRLQYKLLTQLTISAGFLKIRLAYPG